MRKLPYESFALSETKVLKQLKRISLFISFFLSAAGHFSAQTSETFTDGGVSGEISFTHGTNTGHSVIALAPNGIMKFAGPGAIDQRYDFGMVSVESQWLNATGNCWDVFVVPTPC